MNNEELELAIKDILSHENMFDMILAAKMFEKDYKESKFYKETKMPLMEVIKDAKVFYTINLDHLYNRIQYIINNLDLSHLNDLINQLSETFGKENEEIADSIKKLQDIMGK